jgi:O-antigen/teichoic acid export membrane protein
MLATIPGTICGATMNGQVATEAEGPGAQANSGVSRFVRFSLIYAFGDILTKGTRIVLIPFYLGVLSQSEIGELAVLQALVYCTWTVLAFGFGLAVRRFYVDYQQNGDAFASTLWVARLIGGLPFYLLLLAGGFAFCLLSDQALSFELVAIAVTAGFLKGGLNVVEFWLNIREEPVKYRAFTFAQFLLMTALIIYLVSFCKLGVWGAMVGEMLSYACFAFVSAFVLFRRALPRWGLVRWRELFVYCAPILPHNFFMWGLMGADRLILNEYVDRTEIGIYEIGYLLGSVLSIAIQSMRAAWIPIYFRQAGLKHEQPPFGSIASIYLWLTLMVALSGIVFAPEIVILFSLTAESSYAESARVMQGLLLGFVAMAIFMAQNQPLLYARRTGLLAVISGAGLAVNLIINFALIPAWGIGGAVAATIAAYSAMVVISHLAVDREHRWNIGRNVLLMTIGLFLAVALLALLLPSQPTVWLIPVKLLLILAYLLLTSVQVNRRGWWPVKIELRRPWGQFESLASERK